MHERRNVRGEPVGVRARGPDVKAVLVVDDETSTLETTRLLLRILGLHVHVATSGAEALVIARAERLDLALIDQRLPDITGLEVARSLQDEGIAFPWILMSGGMDFELAAQAGRLGAVTAVSLPFDVTDVVTRALAAPLFGPGRPALHWPSPPLRPRLRAARSATERWARLVLLACDAETDLPTAAAWAAFVGVGHSTLRGICTIAGLAARDARDLTRVLRALMLCEGRVSEIESHLLVGDPRTIERLLKRARLSDLRHVSPSNFLAGQRLVPADRPAMQALQCLTAELASDT